jgi:hypothetical protein
MLIILVFHAYLGSGLFLCKTMLITQVYEISAQDF